jgi:hypothetical protein
VGERNGFVMKKWTAVLAILLLVLVACEPVDRYNGKHPQYFSIAINSLLGVSVSWEDSIEVLEQDSKGRIMFAFISNVSSIDGKKGIYSIMICQKADSEYAYFYPDHHFVVAHTKGEITQGQIAALKIINDWDQSIDESKMTKVRISRNKKQDNSRDSRKENIFKDKNEVDFENETVLFHSLGTDKDGRWLYFVWVTDNVKYNDKRYYMLILNKDYSYKGTYLQPLDDVWNYQDQLKKFKELNNWTLYVE